MGRDGRGCLFFPVFGTQINIMICNPSHPNKNKQHQNNRHVVPGFRHFRPPAAAAGRRRPHRGLVLRRRRRRRVGFTGGRGQQCESAAARPLPLLRGHGLLTVRPLRGVGDRPADARAVRLLRRHVQSDVHRLLVHGQDDGDGARPAHRPV